MPHVIVKMYPGRSEEVKQRLAGAIAREVVSIAECPDEVVSVAIEEIDPKDWPEKVYRTDIAECPGKLYKKPGYNPLA